jgi:HSP20 family protein
MLTIQRFGFNPIDPFGMLKTAGINEARENFRECFTPFADVRETTDGYAIDIDLPGLTEKEVEITLEGLHLTIKGERKPQSDAQYTRRERGFGGFERIFRLPDDVDNARIEAKSKNGVLTLTLPKSEAAKPRTISIIGE